MEYTIEQEQAISIRGENILVSAGAGAGKTRVLVSRFIDMLLDENHPVDADTFLVMTFTNAAAAEMKERIIEALNLKLEADPENRRLRKQIRMIKGADICTVHSFCNHLLRTHFNEIGIDPSFRIGEEGELFLLRKNAMEEVLEQAYEEDRESFQMFVESYAPGNQDRVLEEMIESTYHFSRGFPDGKRWFASVLLMGEGLGSEEAFSRSKSCGLLLKNANEKIRYLSGKCKRILSLFEEDHEPQRFYDLLYQDYEILKCLEAVSGYEGYHNALESVIFAELPRAKKTEKEWPYLEQVKDVHKEIRESVLELKEVSFSLSYKQLMEENKKVYPYLMELFTLTEAFSDNYFKKKQEKNVYDFDDLEHLTLDLLVDSYDEEGKPVPTDVAKELGEKYQSVFVDEYQDTNLVQETIIEVITASDHNRLFTVGDVKQSIYRFRLARPDLFLQRYEAYDEVGTDKEETQGKRIELRDNFRSAPSVLHFCNFFFEQLMTRDFGGVDYTKKIGLRPGENGPMESVEEQSEVLFLAKDEEWEELENGVDAVMAESAMIAKRIKELKEEGYAYKDMVILLRSGANRAEFMADYFLLQDIPAVCDNQTGYFHTREISLMMNYLSIVDNVYQDIPMASVLLSSMGCFTEEELVELKIIIDPSMQKGYTLYDLLRLYEQDMTGPLQEKIAAFLALLEEFRQEKKEVPLNVLLWDIYIKTGLYYNVQLMNEGEKRKENLLMLLQKAEDYEKTVFKGLFYFIRYMDQLRSYEIDLGGAAKQTDVDDVVRIMTIHKSKGLEFPIVFVSGLSKRFNMMDRNGLVLFHPELGVGLECVDTVERMHHPSFQKEAIKGQMKQDTLEEELRILYVALTRAKNKLILTGVAESKSLEKYLSAFDMDQAKKTATSYMDWIQAGLMKSNEYLKLLSGHFPAEKIPVGVDTPFLTMRMLHLHELAEELHIKKEEMHTETLDDFMERAGWGEDLSPIQASFSHTYPFEASTRWKRKYTVSELKKLSMQPLPDETEELPKNYEQETIPKPQFLLEGDKEVEPTKRGTIVHKVMELLPFGKIESKKDLYDALEEVAREYPDVKLLAPGQIYKGAEQFLFSPLGEQIRQMDKAKQFFKEIPFTIGLPVSKVNPEATGEETVVVQGVIDGCGKTKDGLFLLDYKTDWIKKGEEAVLLDRYKSQMLYYKIALEQVLEINVTEIYIYSFALKEFIQVTL